MSRDLFKEKNVCPMLICETSEPFDHDDYIYELKLDGFRCISYVDTENTVLRTRHNNDLTAAFPELCNLSHCLNKVQKCILDGELIVIKDGKPDFFELQNRSLCRGFKAELAAKRNPAVLVVFDIIYLDGQNLTFHKLIDRKEILSRTIKEGNGISLCRFIEKNGKALYELTKLQNLEGIVAKRKDSIYYMGKRRREWLKIKTNYRREHFYH